MGSLLTSIDMIIKTIVSSPYFGAIGFVIALISLIYSFYITRRDRKIKSLFSSIMSTNLINDTEKVYNKLEIKYEDNLVSNFTVTKVLIKNIGTDVIRANDISQNNPLIITIVDENITMLDCNIVTTTNSNNNFVLSIIDQFHILIKFEYIDPNDSVVIQLLHTGKNSNSIKLSGVVIGSKPPYIRSDDEKINALVSPTTWFLNNIMVKKPKILLLAIYVFLSICILSSTFSIYILTNSMISLICLFPIIFIVIDLIVMAFRKPDPLRNQMTNEFVGSLFKSALSSSNNKIIKKE